MKITTNHPASSYGIPVFVDDAGNPMDYTQGVKNLRKKLKLNTEEFGALVGVSGRTVEGWEQGRRMPSKSALMLIGKLT